jgi:hypothetical protein
MCHLAATAAFGLMADVQFDVRVAGPHVLADAAAAGAGLMMTPTVAACCAGGIPFPLRSTVCLPVVAS